MMSTKEQRRHDSTEKVSLFVCKYKIEDSLLIPVCFDFVQQCSCDKRDAFMMRFCRDAIMNSFCSPDVKNKKQGD